MKTISMKSIYMFLLVVLLLLPVASGKIFGRKCEGNYALVKVNDSGLITWRVGFFCPFGCAHGYCLSESTVPILHVQSKYTVTPGKVNIITFSITNHGSRGHIKLQTVEKTPWIKLPEEITLEANQTKTLFAIVDMPANLSAYNFTIEAIGSTKFYAPSVLVVEKEGKLASTSIFHPISPAVAIGVLIVIAVIFFWIFTPEPKKEEETF